MIALLRKRALVPYHDVGRIPLWTTDGHGGYVLVDKGQLPSDHGHLLVDHVSLSTAVVGPPRIRLTLRRGTVADDMSVIFSGEEPTRARAFVDLRDIEPAARFVNWAIDRAREAGDLHI